MRLFRRFNEVGTTVLVASHDVHLIEQFGLRGIRLEGGRLQNDTAAPSLAPQMTDPAKITAQE